MSWDAMAKLTQALEQYEGDRIALSIDPRQLFIIIAQLQLALRHPENTGDSAIAAREMTERLINILATVIPEARALDCGWDAAYDVTRDYFDAEF